MYYLVATFPERITAEAAYTELEATNFPLKQVSIFGAGYKTVNQLPELHDPFLGARRQMQRMLIWLVPFGFFAGFTFNQVTQIQIVPGISSLDNSIIGGMFGAIAGGLGSLTVGGGLKVVLSGKSGMPFQERLLQGYYLVAVQGSETQVRQAERLLQQKSPLYLQAYDNN